MTHLNEFGHLKNFTIPKSKCKIFSSVFDDCKNAKIDKAGMWHHLMYCNDMYLHNVTWLEVTSYEATKVELKQFLRRFRRFLRAVDVLPSHERVSRDSRCSRERRWRRREEIRSTGTRRRRQERLLNDVELWRLNVKPNYNYT